MQAAEVLDRYEPAIQKLARFVRPSASLIDHRAQDRSDYVSLFRTTALRAHARCPEAPPFVYASLRNAAADSFYKPKSCTFVSLDEADEQVDEANLENQVAAKELVAQLRAVMPAEDMELLEAWTASKSYTEAWKLAGHPDIRRSKIAKRMQEVIERAKGILEGLSILGPDVGARPLIPSERTVMRERLQKEADHLGIPFTNETSEDELRTMIAARSNQFTSDPGFDPADPKIPECFGLMWGANVDEGCAGCKYKNPCQEKMAGSTIPELLITKGNPAMTPSEIASELGIDVSSVELILASRNKTVQKVDPPAPVQVEAPQPPAPPPPVSETAESPKEESVKATASKKAPKAPKAKAPPKKNGKLPHDEAAAALGASAEDPQVAGSASPVADPAEAPGKGRVTPAAEQAPEQSPRSAKVISLSGRVKPVVAKAKPKNGSSTSSTPSRKPAKQKAKVKAKAPPKKLAPPKAAKRKAPPAKSAKSPPRPEGQEPWGEHTFLARWERERRRSPAIAALRPGQKLTGEYKGVPYEVQCRHGYYLCKKDTRTKAEPVKLPTCYSSVLEITGGKEYPVLKADGKKAKGKTRVMTNWSGPRFFRLGRE